MCITLRKTKVLRAVTGQLLVFHVNKNKLFYYSSYRLVTESS